MNFDNDRKAPSVQELRDEEEKEYDPEMFDGSVLSSDYQPPLFNRGANEDGSDVSSMQELRDEDFADDPTYNPAGNDQSGQSNPSNQDGHGGQDDNDSKGVK